MRRLVAQRHTSLGSGLVFGLACDLALTGALAGALGAVALSAEGCASSVKGSWACAVDRGGVCASIHDIDHANSAAPSDNGALVHASVLKGAIPARLWAEGGSASGPIAGAPIRESDPVVKISVAPWIDEAGDYHAGADIFAVMRKASWFVRPPARSQRVDLAPVHPLRLPSAPTVGEGAADPIALPPKAPQPTAPHKTSTGAPS